METIKNYLDNMFSGLPKTDEMATLKENIYENMQDKYQELKASGKSEHETIGVVISEFGNIEELLDEFGLAHDTKIDEKETPTEPLPEVNMETAKEYLKLKKTVGKFVGIGVSLCIIGVVIMIICQTAIDFHSNMGQGLGLAIMFLFIAGGVALFVYSGFLMSPYAYMESQFHISAYVKQQISAEWKIERPSYLVKLVFGICMCVISPVPLFLGIFTFKETGNMRMFGVIPLLLIVAVGVYFIILAGNVMEAYERLLEIGAYTPSLKKGNKIIELVASVVWPLATASYLLIGFLFNLWHPGWIIFPITGVLFGIFSAVVEGISVK